MSTDVTRLLTDTGGLALWCLLLGVCLHRDNRQLRNGFLALLVALWSIRLVSRLADLVPGLDVPVTLGSAALIVFTGLMPLLLVLNGVVLLRREGIRLGNVLSLLAGLGLVAAPVVAVALVATANPWGLLAAMLLFCLCLYLGVFLVILLAQTAVQRIWGGRRAVPHPDAVVVHGSGLIDGKVPPLLASRVRRGIRAWRDEDRLRPGVPLLVMSGGQGPDEPVSEAQAMADYAVTQGVAHERILVEGRSATTQENIALSRELLARQGMPQARVLLVTSSFHAVRTAVLASDMGTTWAVAWARTAWYFSVNAWLREYVAVLTYRRTAALVWAGLTATGAAAYTALVVAGYISLR